MPRPLHVLHVIDSIGALGGAERGLVQEVCRFDRVRSTVVVLAGRSPLRAVLADAGVDVIELDLPHGALLSRLPLGLWRVLGIIRRVRPDVIHTSLFHGNLVGQVAGWMTRVPVVSTLVSSGERYGSADAGMSRGQAALLGVARTTARLARPRYRALTHHAAASNAAVFGVHPDAVTVIPRGVDLADLAAPSADVPVHRLPGNPALLNVGRHFPAKAQWDLIEALGTVVGELPEAHLGIVGQQGPTTERLQKRIADLGLGACVDLLDTVDDIAPLLRGADVFAFSSHHEGLGTAVLEALAIGLPVVSYDIPSVREVTDDGRFATLVPLGDIAALAAALLAAGRLAPDAAAAAARRAWIAENFEAGVVAGMVEDLLISAARVPPT